MGSFLARQKEQPDEQQQIEQHGQTERQLDERGRVALQQGCGSGRVDGARGAALQGSNSSSAVSKRCFESRATALRTRWSSHTGTSGRLRMSAAGSLR